MKSKWAEVGSAVLLGIATIVFAPQLNSVEVSGKAPTPAPRTTQRVAVCVQSSTMVLRWSPDNRCARRGEFTVSWSTQEGSPQLCVDMRTRIMKLADRGGCPRGAMKVARLTQGTRATACVDVKTKVLKRPRTGRCLSANLTVTWFVVRDAPRASIEDGAPKGVLVTASTTSSLAPSPTGTPPTTAPTTTAPTTTAPTTTAPTTTAPTTTTSEVAVEWLSCVVSRDCQYALMVTFDLKFQDLSGVDFSFADLGGAELNGANLTNANFTSANLRVSIWDEFVSVSNTTFRYTDLSYVDFHGVNLQGIDFYGARLPSVDMREVILNGSDLRQSDISGADFSGASLVGVLFNVGVVTEGAMFTAALMSGVDMSNMTLSGAVGFQGTDLRNANFSAANAFSASFSGANLTNANFRNADLSYANFTNAVLTGADFSGATLTGADFAGATDGPDLSTTTTSTSTTTTVAAATCATGGSCVVGDTGPGGGVVVYTAGTGSATYMEVAPQTWYASTESAFRWCYPQTNLLAGASGTAVGTGLSNTTAMRVQCTTNGAAYWLNFKNVNGGIGGKTDWFIPSKAELNYVCLYARQLAETVESCSGGTLRPGFVAASYWSSSEYDPNRAWYQNFSNGGQAYVDGLKGTSVYVRPVRFFGS